MFIETIKFNEVSGSQGNVFLAELVKGDKGKMKPDHPISGKVQKGPSWLVWQRLLPGEVWPCLS